MKLVGFKRFSTIFILGLFISADGANGKPADPQDFLTRPSLSLKWPREQKTGRIKRRVFSLWSSKLSKEIYLSTVIRNIESVLNHMGVFVEYLDIDKEPFPKMDQAWRERYLGLITYFENEKLESAEKLFQFLGEFKKTRLPWVALGRFGFLEKIPKEKLAPFFSSLGVKYTGYSGSPYFVQLVKKDRRLMEFERPMNKVFKHFPPIVTDDRQSRVGLRLRIRAGPVDSTPVFIGSKFSMAYGEHGLQAFPEKALKAWQVNPFRFLRHAFSLDPRVPVPDVSVLNGRRVYYSHIDGDGFHSLSLIKEEGKKKKYCGEKMAEDIFERYAYLPFGVSIIVAEVDPEYHGNAHLLEAAKKILAADNVEVASHTTTHPLFWVKGKVAYPKYGLEFEEKFETVGSIEYIKKNLAAGKPVEALYWSGDCMPKAIALKHLEDAGLLNMNGGDSLFDKNFPSFAFVSPLGRPMGELYQVFAANSNDNIYTNGWEGPYSGFRRIIETFENTGKPIVYKPINPYFHFFSAERQAGLDAIVDSIEWALKRPIAPVFPTVYIRSVLGSRNAEIEPVGQNRFLIDGADGLLTFRLDQVSGRVPDLKSSKGFLGYRIWNEALYIHRDPSHKGRLELVLRNGKTNGIYLKEAGGLISSVRRKGNKLLIDVAPFVRDEIVLAGIVGRKIRYSFKKNKEKSVLVRGNEVRISIEPSTKSRLLEVKF